MEKQIAGTTAHIMPQAGDIFVYEFGYEARHNHFFQVVRVTAKCVKVRRIASDRANGALKGYERPVRDAFKSAEVLVRKVIFFEGKAMINMAYGFAYLTPPEKAYFFDTLD